jgi:hypothetical protein
MDTKDIPSEVYAFETDERNDIAVKRAKQQFAKDHGYEYGNLLGKKLQRIPAYGIRVYVCHEPSLWKDVRR